MTVEDAEFVYGLGKFVVEADMEGLDVSEIEEKCKAYVQKLKNYDNAINFLCQAVQIQNGFILGIYGSLSIEQKVNADMVLDDVIDNYKRVENELDWVPLTKVN